MMAKSDVNGVNTNEVFAFLKKEKSGLLGTTAISECQGAIRHESQCVSDRRRPPSLFCVISSFHLIFRLARPLEWNFTKFLVDRQGNVVERFSPTAKPVKDIAPKIETLLQKS